MATTGSQARSPTDLGVGLTADSGQMWVRTDTAGDAAAFDVGAAGEGSGRRAGTRSGGVGAGKVGGGLEVVIGR